MRQQALQEGALHTPGEGRRPQPTAGGVGEDVVQMPAPHRALLQAQAPMACDAAGEAAAGAAHVEVFAGRQAQRP